MTNKIKHKVTIYEKLENGSNPFAYGSQNDLIHMASDLFKRKACTNHPIGPTLHISKTTQYNGIQQIVKNGKIITKQMKLPFLGEYGIQKAQKIYKGKLTVQKLEEIVYMDDFPYFDKVDEKWINDALNTLAFAEDMHIYLEFELEDNKLLLVRKVFTHVNKNYYFDYTKPSIYALNQEGILISYNHIPFNLYEKQYLRVDHYQKLSKLVYTTINPDEDKVYPAIIITETDGSVVEIHFTYKGNYVSEEILNELKPNRLKENFRDPNYFNKQDIEFLDMLGI